MRKIIFSLFFIPAVLLNNQSHAQIDAHFTQYYAYPLWLNPAFTGMIDGSYRVAVNYRKQWPESAAALKAQAVSGDVVLSKQFSVGLTIFNQQTGDGAYQSTNGYFSLSYKVAFSEHDFISSGFQLGLLNRKINPAKFQFGSQFNPLSGYDPSIPSGETFINQSSTVADGSIGLLYFNDDQDKKINPFIGASLYHPTEPVSQFIQDGEDNKVAMRYSIHGGIRLKMSEQFELTPHIIYTAQGKANETAAGLQAGIKIDADKDVLFGGTYRLNDAVAPNIGLHLGGLTLGFSYDINVSQFKTGATANGGYELSISFINPSKIASAKPASPRL